MMARSAGHGSRICSPSGRSTSAADRTANTSSCREPADRRGARQVAIAGAARDRLLQRDRKAPRVAAQQRALAHLESADGATDQSAEELAELRRERRGQAEIERLTRRCERAEADRQAALSAETEAGAKAAEHSAALAQADAALRSARSDAATRIQELEAALAAATNESRSLATELQEIRARADVQTVTLSRRVQAALTEATGLRAELDRANSSRKAYAHGGTDPAAARNRRGTAWHGPAGDPGCGRRAEHRRRGHPPSRFFS